MSTEPREQPDVSPCTGIISHQDPTKYHPSMFFGILPAAFAMLLETMRERATIGLISIGLLTVLVTSPGSKQLTDFFKSKVVTMPL